MLRAAERQFERMAELERAAAGGEMDAVHDFRVAVRRLRSALRLLKGAHAATFRKGAAAFGDDFGAVRNLDVLLGRHDLPATLKASLNQARRTALRRAAAGLEGKSYKRWREALQEWLDDGRPRAKDKGLETALVRQAEELAVRPPRTDAEIHRLRIAVKGLRYLLEFFEDDLSKQGAEACRDLAGLQDRLGAHCDLVAFDVILARFVRRSTEAAEYRRRLSQERAEDDLKAVVAAARKIGRRVASYVA